MEHLNKHLLEIVAASFSLLSTIFLVRNNLKTWLFSIVTFCLYFFIYLKKQLYAIGGLQIIYLLQSCWGLYQWRFGWIKKNQLKISSASGTLYFTAIIWIAFLFSIILFILRHYTTSTTPFSDAFITASSLFALWLTTRKILENWLLWILIDLIAVYLYLKKDLYITAGLYTIFLILGVLGYIKWKKEIAPIKRSAVQSRAV
jgi:nicotinamide mononucleotide transporter